MELWREISRQFSVSYKMNFIGFLGFHLSGFDCPLDAQRGFLLVFVQARAIAKDARGNE